VGRVFSSAFADCYVVTRHGAKLVVTPESLDFFTTLAQSNWAFDYWVLDTCADLLPDDGVFYDVGANAGYLSLEMTRLKPSCKLVVSFEPQARLVNNLRKSRDLNGITNMTVIDSCVGDVVGTTFFASEAHSIHAHVKYPGDYSEGKSRGVEVAQLTLDDAVGNGNIPPPDVIKIDVEGYEYNVLEGARAVIARYHPHIVFELSDATPQFDRRPRDYFDLLSALGNYTYEVAVGSYRDAVFVSDLEAFDAEFVKRPHQTNILARSVARDGGGCGGV
jgi:FkbM family methyltransferase